MFNFMKKLAAHNDAIKALAPAVASLGLVYCWAMSLGMATASSGLSII